MSTAIVQFSNDQLSLIKSTVAKDATNDELALFLHQCKRMGLDPLSKQIYFQKYRNNKTGESKMTIIVGIDGYRITADRTGKYAGNDDPVFDDDKKPTRATVTVYKMVEGQRCPFTATARWDQYYPGETKGHIWRKMPNLMLGKTAEALALRKAFPAELSGAYVKEEMEQAEAPAIDAQTGEVRDNEAAKLNQKVIEAKIEAPQADHISQMISAFDELGVSAEDLEKMTGKSLDQIDEKTLQFLRSVYATKKSEKGKLE